MLTPEQLTERRTGIGGSDAGIVLNIHPFREPLWLYHDKRGELPMEEVEKENPAFVWGSYLEEPICQVYAEKFGFKIQRVNQLIRSKTHPFMIAHVDRRVVGEDRRIGVEAKSDAFGYGWGPSGTNEIPPYIFMQCQHYLAVTGWDEWDLPVLIGNRDARYYKIYPVEAIIKTLIDAEEQFWDRIQHGVAPDANYEHRSTWELISKLYPGTNGSVVRLPDIAQRYTDVLEDAKKQAKIYDNVIEGCKNRIGMLMGEASAGLLPDGTCYVRKEVERKGYTVADNKYMSLAHVEKLPKLVTEALEKNVVIEQAAVTAGHKEIEHGT